MALFTVTPVQTFFPLEFEGVKKNPVSAPDASLVPEALFKMCKDKGFRLLWYDYNEPCKGKDQCDRESAAAKTIIRSFVNAGNDLISADDVYKSLHYGSGMKDGQISVAEADSERASLTGKKIDKFTSFHSIEFHDQHMQLWR